MGRRGTTLRRSAAHPSFLERTLAGLAGATDREGAAERWSCPPGFAQSLDPRAKLVGAALLIFATVAAREWAFTGAVLALAVLVGRLSRIGLRALATHVWLGVAVFTGPIALPALFTVPGAPLWQLAPFHGAVTAPGARSALQLLLRAEASATWAFLAVATTPWPQLWKALGACGVPGGMLVILAMAHRYVFLLLRLAQEGWQARRCRLVGTLRGRERRRLVTASAGVLLEKSLDLSEEVYAAMVARGFRGAVHTLDEFCFRRSDFWTVAGCALVAGLSLVPGAGR